MRGRISTLLAATMLTLAIGLQVLEATGRWDRTFQDTGDEAIIVVVVFCMGAALVAARTLRPQFSLSRVQTPIVPRLAIRLRFVAPPTVWSAVTASPPLSLRI